MLDNGIFCQWDKIFNAALRSLRAEYHAEKNPGGQLKRGPKAPLPLEWTCKALKTSIESVLTKPAIYAAVSITTNVYDKNPDGSITEPPRITLSREYATRKMSGWRVLPT